METQSVEEALKHWKESRTHFIALCLIYLANDEHTMTELSLITGIKRTTLYYMLFGKEGRHEFEKKGN